MPILVVGAFVAFVAGAQATPGNLDPAYSGDGMAYANFGGNDAQANSMVVDESNRAVLAGYVDAATDDIAVARFKLDGTLDGSAFSGDTGKLIIDMGGNERAASLAIGGDHKLVIAGTTDVNGTNDAFIMKRLMPTGNADTSFNAAGPVPGQNIINIGGNDQATVVVIRPNGHYFVGGTTTVNGTTDFFIAAVTDRGTLDPSFTNGTSPMPGVILVNFGGTDILTGIWCYSGTKWLATGYSDVNGNNDIAMASFKSRIQPDPGFGGPAGGHTGRVVFAHAGDDRALALRVDNNKKILIAGSSGNDMLVARFKPGAKGVDPSFAGGGWDVLNYGGTDGANALLYQAKGDRKILPAGFTNATGNNDFALARLSKDGAPDSQFGAGGFVTTNFNGTSVDVATGIGVQSNTNLVLVGGYSNANGNYQFAVARYLPT